MGAVVIMANNHTTPPSVPRCHAKKASGAPCNATPMAGKQTCFFHSDDEQTRLRAAQKGGLASRPRWWPPDFPDPQLRSPADVVVAVEQIYGAVTRGELSPHLANPALYAASIAVRALDLQIDARLDRLERAINAGKATEFS